MEEGNDLQAEIDQLRAEKEEGRKREEEFNKKVEAAAKEAEAAKKKIAELEKANSPQIGQFGEAIVDAIAGMSMKRDAEKHRPTFKPRWSWTKKKTTLDDGTTGVEYPQKKSTPIAASISIRAFPSSLAKAPTDCVALVANLRVLCPLSPLSGPFCIGGALFGVHGKIFTNTAKSQTADETALSYWLEKDEHMDIFSWRQSCYLMRAIIDANTDNFPELSRRYWTHVTEVDMRTTESAWPVYLLYDCLVREQMSASLVNGEFPEWLGIWDKGLFDTARARFGASLDDVTQKVVQNQWAKVIAVPEKNWPEIRDSLIALETKVVKGQTILLPPCLTALKVPSNFVPEDVSCPSIPRVIAPAHSSNSSSRPLIVGNSSQRSGSSNNNSNNNAGSSNQGGSNGNRGGGGGRSVAGNRQVGGGQRDQPFRPRLCVGCGNKGHTIGACNALYPRLERIPSTSPDGSISWRVRAKEGNKPPICQAYNLNDNHRNDCNNDDSCSKCGEKHPLVAHPGLGLADAAIHNLN